VDASPRVTSGRGGERIGDQRRRATREKLEEQAMVNDRKKPERSVMVLLVAMYLVVLPNAGHAETQEKAAGETDKGWIADPFAGTTAIEIEHLGRSPGPEIYRITDRDEVAALMKRLVVVGFSEMVLGCGANAVITFHKADGSAFQTTVQPTDGHGTAVELGVYSGQICVEKGFFQALNECLSAKVGTPVNVLESLPPLPREDDYVAPSSRSLTAGFVSVEIEYKMGKRSRRARVVDPESLRKLHEALVILDENPPPKEGPRGRSLNIISRDKSPFAGTLVDRETLYHWKVGLFKIEPSFVDALNRIASEVEGRPIDVLKDNALTEEQIKKNSDARQLLSDVTCIRWTARRRQGELDIEVSDPKEVQALMAPLEWVEVPLRELKVAEAIENVELSRKDGQKLQIRVMRTGEMDREVRVSPYLSDLVEVSDFGQAWIPDGWRYGLSDYAGRVESAEKAEQRKRTVRRVAQDWNGFLEEVVSMTVFFREGSQQCMTALYAGSSAKVIPLLAAQSVERFELDKEQWKSRSRDPNKRGGAYLKLIPGLGFSLPLYLSGEKEGIIPDYGRITFRQSPAEALRSVLASDPESLKAIQVLPRTEEEIRAAKRNLEQGIAHFEAGRHEDAEKALEESLASGPSRDGEKQARYHLCRIYMKRMEGKDGPRVEGAGKVPGRPSGDGEPAKERVDMLVKIAGRLKEFAGENQGSPLAAQALFRAGEAYLEGKEVMESYQALKRVVWDCPDSEWVKAARQKLKAPVFDKIPEMYDP